MNLLKILAALLAVVMAGCTGLRIAYPQADILLGWRANTYFDLDREQRQDFSARLDRLLAWHRREQLPDYALFLNTAIDKAEHSLKQEDISWFIDGLKTRYRVIVNRGANDAAEVLATLNPEQLAGLQKQFEKDNRKFTSENELDGGMEKRKRARLKKMLSQIEDWTGDLTRDQERKVAALLDPAPLSEHLRHQDRMRRQHEFVELLKTRRAKPDFPARLGQWLLAWEQSRTQEYARIADEVYDQRVHFFIAVDKLLTPEQRKRALGRLQKFADDCKTLSARAPARAGDERLETAILALF
ncbi:MAG: DUF6279 family lipoprotein [Burkholderiales bacterium]